MEVFCPDLESKVLEPSTELLASLRSLASTLTFAGTPIPSLKHLARNEGGLAGKPRAPTHLGKPWLLTWGLPN